ATIADTFPMRRRFPLAFSSTDAVTILRYPSFNRIESKAMNRMNARYLSWAFVRSRTALIGRIVAVLGCSIVAGSQAAARAAPPRSMNFGRTSLLGPWSWAYAQRA